jgi:hypothetical protein
VLEDLDARLGVVHPKPGPPLGVGDERGAELGVVRKAASSAAKLSSETKRCRSSGVIARPRSRRQLTDSGCTIDLVVGWRYGATP